MTPSLGRIVHYKLTTYDAKVTNERRSHLASQGEGWPKGAIEHAGFPVSEGDTFAAMIVSVNHNRTHINLQVFLDGNDVLWATSVSEGDKNGQWVWPPRT